MVKRDNQKDLMEAVFALVKENGCYDRAEVIMDYFLPTDRDLFDLTNYGFDFIAAPNFGGSEGIYIDCYLNGEYVEDMEIFPKRLHIGTFKTLRDDLEAMQIMGELCGSLTYFAFQYVNREIDRYTPTKELLAQEQRRKEREAERGKGE